VRKIRIIFFCFLLFLESLVILNYGKSSEFHDNQLNFIINLQVLDESNIDNYGGFKSIVGENESNLRNTFYGLHLLEKLRNNLSLIDRFACIEYISGRSLIDGGYEPEAKMSTSYIDSTYFAIHSLNFLDANSWIAPNVSSWIKQRQNLNIEDSENYGGFEWKKNFNTTYMEATYYGIQSLVELNSLHSVNTIVLLNWLEERKNPDGGFSPTASIHFSTIMDTYFAVETMINLNSLDSINMDLTISFIKQLQDLNSSDKLNYGGFKPFEGPFNTSLKATYYAIKLLYDVNQLEKINSTLVIQYVYSKLVETGGFKDTYSEYPNIADTFFAINIISLIEDWKGKGHDGNQTPINNMFIGIFLLLGVAGVFIYFKSIKTSRNSHKIKRKVKGGRKRY